MPHTLSDVLDRAEARPRSRRRDARGARCATRSSEVPGVSALFTTPLGMRIDEGLGGTPADISVRIFGPDLAALARPRRRPPSDRVRRCRRHRRPARRAARRLAAAARRGRSRRGGARRAHAGRRDRGGARSGWSAQAISEVWIGQRRFDLVVQARTRIIGATPTTLRDAPGRRPRRHAHPARQARRDRADVRARRRSSAKPAAGGSRSKRSVAGRDLGSAAQPRCERALAKRAAAAAGLLLRRRWQGREPGARAASAATSPSALALLAVFLLLYLALGSLAETLVILATLPERVRRRHRRAARSRARPGTSRRSSA